jgi:alpha-tubulin suppressor-like RCC1 family protein
VASGRADAPGTVVAIRSDGSLYTWGWNTTGSQWSFSVAVVRSSPTLLDSGSWTSVDGSVLDSFIALKNGIPYSWGYNADGQLGIGDTLARSSPVQIGNAPDINTLSPVQIGSSSWSQVSAGNQFTLARDINGNLYTWGQDTSGQLGF